MSILMDIVVRMVLLLVCMYDNIPAFREVTISAYRCRYVAFHVKIGTTYGRNPHCIVPIFPWNITFIGSCSRSFSDLAMP